MEATAVKPEPVLTPGTLRAYLARHDVRRTDIARRRGVTRNAIYMALRADLTGRPVSQNLLRQILDVANQILLERDAA